MPKSIPNGMVLPSLCDGHPRGQMNCSEECLRARCCCPRKRSVSLGEAKVFHAFEKLCSGQRTAYSIEFVHVAERDECVRRLRSVATAVSSIQNRHREHHQNHGSQRRHNHRLNPTLNAPGDPSAHSTAPRASDRSPRPSARRWLLPLQNELFQS